MNVFQINKIEELFDFDGKIVKHEVQRLVPPGENYGSLMLSVVLTLQTPNGTEEIHTVFKKIPPNKYLQEIFKTQISFRNEIAFYKKIVPALQQFQRENGIESVIDFAPRYYGSRINLDDDDKKEVDEDAVLILENLKTDNYFTLPRSQSLDLDVTKLVLKNLAHFHAVALAMRLKKPETFETEIKPYLSYFPETEDRHNHMKEAVIKVMDKIEELSSLKHRILVGFDKQLNQFQIREPYATMIHTDCWTTNIMAKFEGDRVVKIKLVDYQFCRYASPSQDLLFFLFMSVKCEVIKRYYQDLLRFYHQTFIEILEELHCDTKPFTFEALEKEMDHESVLKFAVLLFRLIPMFAEQKHVAEMEDFNPTSIGDIVQTVSDPLKEKVIFIVDEFIKRKWI